MERVLCSFIGIILGNVIGYIVAKLRFENNWDDRRRDIGLRVVNDFLWLMCFFACIFSAMVAFDQKIERPITAKAAAEGVFFCFLIISFAWKGFGLIVAWLYLKAGEAKSYLMYKRIKLSHDETEKLIKSVRARVLEQYEKEKNYENYLTEYLNGCIKDRDITRKQAAALWHARPQKK